ncbi:MAG: D-glucosaminate-6-phosphate ammonia lyase [Alphaproteobacteria bacterium MarineAlpha5_Bin6]|nr:MAG: D-glucosaminate-6-phosphate ammonia lyase [Alphaproteobacteria bacterium MarineAlpha5_Bin7]PPR54271.1 MAG: D-glucosaminate-6-phosphate ammonia lyase [Alphaproteobacteria bacterium MarineAlpha5_Bin6]|tara:strand:+ start:2321 stop:3529 length:1209 start_codon:yes stop_codon:yes gene_type:complete
MNIFYKKNKLTPIINVSGFMTKIGASIVKKQNIYSANEVLPNFVNIDELQSLASKRISKLFNSESAVITASAAAGLTESIAAMMTGNNLDKIFQLPNTKNMKSNVIIQQGHLTNYGAEVGQAIKLSGAKIIKCGSRFSCKKDQLIDKINNNINKISCAMYVVSHHCSDYNSLNLNDFLNICKKFKIPTIIDAASEEYMHEFFNLGADVAIFSSHKFMGSLTAGIVAGKKKYIKNIYLQNLGIGRGMKVGKEGIYSSIIAVENWYKRNVKSELSKQNKIISYWLRYLDKKNYKGINYEIIPDPTGNKINRLRIIINKELSNFTAYSLAHHLENNNPSIFVRDDLIHLDHFELDTCNLKKNQEKIVMVEMNKIINKLVANKIKNNIGHKLYKRLSMKSWLKWPD